MWSMKLVPKEDIVLWGILTFIGGVTALSYVRTNGELSETLVAAYIASWVLLLITLIATQGHPDAKHEPMPFWLGVPSFLLFGLGMPVAALYLTFCLAIVPDGMREYGWKLTSISHTTSQGPSM